MLVGNVRTLLLLWFCMSHRAWGDPWEKGKKELLASLPRLRKAWEASSCANAPDHVREVRCASPGSQQCQSPSASLLGFQLQRCLSWSTLCSPQLLKCPFYLEAEWHLLLHSCLFLILLFSVYLTDPWKKSWMSRWFSHLFLDFCGWEFLLQNYLCIIYGIIMQCTACQNILLFFYFSSEQHCSCFLIMLIIVVSSCSHFKL